jgi:hypothetical protein
VDVEALTAQMKTAASRVAGQLGPLGMRPGRAGCEAGGRPSRLRSFDPGRIADLEYRAWVGYYLREWPQVLAASVGLVRTGFGMDWYRTLHGAWLVLRANQLWAPFPDNDPDRARACMRRFYALVKLSYGKPASPAKAAALEVDWWRAHRETQLAAQPAGAADELVESVTHLYSYLYGEPEAEVRPAAVHRARAMDLSDQWIREGCPPDSPLLPLEHAALVRCYAALLAAVHH